MNYGYVRVSTAQQHIDRQIDALLQLGIDKKSIYIDYESGRDFNRKNYKKLIKKIEKNDLLIIEENNKNMVILYRKHKYLVEHTGINTYVARAEENLPAREHKKDTQNFVLIKADKKDRIKNNKSQATV